LIIPNVTYFKNNNNNDNNARSGRFPWLFLYRPAEGPLPVSITAHQFTFLQHLDTLGKGLGGEL